MLFHQHFHAFSDLLMRLFGSLAVFADVSFFFIPVILAQKESRREPPCGCGGFKPGLPGLAALYDALPFAFSPPLGFLPSFLVHAGDFAIIYLQTSELLALYPHLVYPQRPL